jgi:uncharacterized protein YqeY
LVKYQKDNSIAEPTDEQLISQLEKYIAERKKTIATLNEANGNSYDLGDKIADEETEMKLAISFLPEELQAVYNATPLTEEEIKEKLEEIISKNNFSGMKDMGGVMKIAKEELKGTDMKIISSLVKTLLN